MPPFDRACPARVAKLAGRSFTIAPLEPISGGANAKRQLVEDITGLTVPEGTFLWYVSRLSCFRNEVNSVLIPTCSLASRHYSAPTTDTDPETEPSTERKDMTERVPSAFNSVLKDGDTPRRGCMLCK